MLFIRPACASFSLAALRGTKAVASFKQTAVTDLFLLVTAEPPALLLLFFVTGCSSADGLKS